MAQFIPHGAMSCSEIEFDFFIIMPNVRHNPPQENMPDNPFSENTCLEAGLHSKNDALGVGVHAVVMQFLYSFLMRRNLLIMSVDFQCFGEDIQDLQRRSHK